MIRKTIVSTMLISALMLVVTASSFAADLVIPSWRGQSGTTFQQWDFTTEANPAAPEVVNNAYGAPSASVAVDPMFGAGWLDQLPGMGTLTGYWDLGGGGTIALDVNGPASGDYTDIWVQVTYFMDITAAPAVDVAGGTLMGGESRVVESVETGGQWVLDQSIWRIQPSAASAKITLTSDAMFGADVDSVVVDTQTQVVPEPASLAALLAGCFGLVVRRRKA